jgi:hypothetical protein
VYAVEMQRLEIRLRQMAAPSMRAATGDFGVLASGVTPRDSWE